MRLVKRVYQVYTVIMKFEWDEKKNQTNVQIHGFDFTDAHKIFNLPMLTKLDARKDYGEDRWVGIGLLELRVVVIVYTEPSPDTIRVISLRKALSYERKRYEQEYKDEFGAD